MNSSLLLQLCPACLVRRIWMVLEMRGKCPYSCCFVGCCFPDLFNMARGILVQLLFSFFSYALSEFMWCIHIVQLAQPLFGRNCGLLYRIALTSIDRSPCLRSAQIDVFFNR